MKRKIGVGPTMPKGEAKPLGTKPSKRAQRHITKRVAVQSLEQTVDSIVPDAVASSQSAAITLPQAKDSHMTLTRSGLSKNGKTAMYSGLRNVLRIPVIVFEGGTAPDSLTLDGAAFAVAKIVETKEQRKARIAALPKPTLAEKVAKRQKQLDAMKAKLDAEAVTV